MVSILFILALFEDFENETELYEAIKNGNQKAFKSFFDEHFDSLFRFLTSRGINSEDAEDLIQQAFLYIWEKRDTIKPDLSLRAYLFQIAYSRMINLSKRKNKTTSSEFDTTETGLNNPEENAEFTNLEECLQNAVDDMPEKRQAVFTLCFMEELTYKEAAEVLDVSIKTIENHMSLAFKDVRAALAPFKNIEKNINSD